MSASLSMPSPWKLVVGAITISVSACVCLLALLASVLVKLPHADATSNAPGDLAAVIAYAEAQIDQPYLWGGEGSGGFDCSGLVQSAFAAGGIPLPRIAQDQFDAGPLLAPEEEPGLGDLVFFGSGPNGITHVGISIGNGQMIDAPHAGATVRIESFRWKNYVGATRPGSGGDASPID